MTSPLYLAIDNPHLDAALTLAQKVRRHVGGLKLGLEFFCANVSAASRCVVSMAR